MRLLDFFKPKTVTKIIQSEASHGYYGGVYSISFDGEKNLGEVGPAINYHLDYTKLRVRSWQAYLESELAQIILDRVNVWVIGKGLKLQSQPSKQTLLSEGINFNSEAFNKVVEARFGTWANSKQSSYSGNETLNDIQSEAFKNCNIAGDVLQVIRYQKGKVTVQNIDANSIYCMTLMKSSRGNKIVNGVEIDGKGKHVGYWYTETDTQKSSFISAYETTTGLRVAWLVYGNKYKIDSVRGLPAIAQSLESIKKTERYKEATVGAAEEVSKIALQIVHDSFSDGESPLTQNTMDALDVGVVKKIPSTTEGDALANKITATTNKTAINNPVGAKIETINQSNNTIAFKEFYGTMAEYICASMMIPPNVAFSLYNDSFSASRAATKDWEHTIEYKRSYFQSQSYDYIYRFWFHMEVLNNKIQAPGYFQAFQNGNHMVVDAYLNCRFTGPMFPHIDPLKEVKAEREKLGELGKHIPLTTVEMATEVLNGGESTSNMEQFSEEWKEMDILIPRTEPSNQDNMK